MLKVSLLAIAFTSDFDNSLSFHCNEDCDLIFVIRREKNQKTFIELKVDHVVDC